MEALDLSLSLLLLLCLAAIVAGFLDTLVGGGGLITIPALLACGVPPIFALGTNKLQAVGGSGTASYMMISRGKVEFNDVKVSMLYAFFGSVVGTILVQFINAGALNVLIPIVIALIALYFLLVPTFAAKESSQRSSVLMSDSSYRKTVVPVIGCYDGMFGPATGSFFVLAGVSLRGQEIIQATATAKTLNFATNAASLLVFIFYGNLLWLVGGVMIIGQLLGANVGSHYLLRINPMALRYLLVAMSFTMLVVWFSN